MGATTSGLITALMLVDDAWSNYVETDQMEPMVRAMAVVRKVLREYDEDVPSGGDATEAPAMKEAEAGA
jgi:hypothetical protein